MTLKAFFRSFHIKYLVPWMPNTYVPNWRISFLYLSFYEFLEGINNNSARVHDALPIEILELEGHIVQNKRMENDDQYSFASLEHVVDSTSMEILDKIVTILLEMHDPTISNSTFISSLFNDKKEILGSLFS